MTRTIRYVVMTCGVGVIGLGIVVFRAGGQSPLFNTAPLDNKIEIRTGTRVHSTFRVEKAEKYQINIELPTPRTTARITELEEQTDRIEATWQVTSSRNVGVPGRSHERSWFSSGDVSGKTIGEFTASPGVYTLDAVLTSVPEELQGVSGRLLIVLNQNSLTDLGYTIELLPYLRYVGVAVALLGGVLVLFGWFFGSNASAA